MLNMVQENQAKLDVKLILKITKEKTSAGAHTSLPPIILNRDNMRLQTSKSFAKFKIKIC